MLKKAALQPRVEAGRRRESGLANGPAMDPITVAIIQNALQAASDEMFAAMRKTAMSAIIYEVLDMGTGLTDGDGNLASSGQGIPAFVGVLDKAVQFILGKHAAPGTMPPTSFQCAITAVQATMRSPEKTGIAITTSLRWVTPPK